MDTVCVSVTFGLGSLSVALEVTEPGLLCKKAELTLIYVEAVEISFIMADA